MNHPLMPTLYDDPIVNMAYDRWDRYHIWLHKQPLFLWQIALSFKLFGVSEFTLRLPNIVLGTALVLITYRSGKLLFNQRTGYVASLFILTTIYLLELVAGRQELEHNDFSFLVYISLSIWSFIEYYFSKRKFWIYLIGLFSGMAILCKWLVGLLVYFGWFVLKALKHETKIKKNVDILISLGITLLISLPWQILIFEWYPAEAQSAYKFNLLHFSSALEGHSGSFLYHIENFSAIYGFIAPFLIVPAFVVFVKRGNDKKLMYSLVGMVLIVYLFFSLAATKMPSFTTVVTMIIIIAFASLFDYIVLFIDGLLKNKTLNIIAFSVLLITALGLRFDIKLLEERHTLQSEDNHYTRILSNNKLIFQSLELPPNTVLFNVKGRHYIEAMFYTGLPAYNFIPTFEQHQEMKNQNRKIAVFTTNKDSLPDYLKNDSTTIILEKEIKGWD